MYLIVRDFENRERERERERKREKNRKYWPVQNAFISEIL